MHERGNRWLSLSQVWNQIKQLLKAGLRMYTCTIHMCAMMSVQGTGKIWRDGAYQARDCCGHHFSSNTSIYTCIHIHIYTYLYIYTCKYACMYRHVYIHVHVYIYMHTHAYKHTVVNIFANLTTWRNVQWTSWQNIQSIEYFARWLSWQNTYIHTYMLI
jgi:hypothetical protein